MLCDANGKIISEYYPISVSSVADGFKISATAPEFVGGTDNIDSRNMAVTTTVSCSEGYFVGPIYAVWFAENGSTYRSFDVTNSDIVFIEALNSKEVTFGASFDNLDLSKRYAVAIYYNNNGSLTQISNLTIFNITSGIDDVVADGKFNIYTNGDVVNVTSPDNIKRIDIFSLTGQQVANRMVADGAGAASIDVSNLTPGVYVVKVITAGDTHVERIVKK